MNEKDKLLHNLYFQFCRADKAYSAYLKERIFLFATSIRKANNQIYELLENNGYLLDEPQKTHALNLIFHYDIWMRQFNELEKKLKPAIDAEFVFERYPDTPPFPSASKEAFVKAYNELVK